MGQMDIGLEASGNLDELADRHLQHKMIKYEEVTGKGKKQISFADVPLDIALKYAADPYRLGIALHALQDSYSHQGFTGWDEQVKKEFSARLYKWLERDNIDQPPVTLAKEAAEKAMV